MTSEPLEFELSYRGEVYFGTYRFEGKKLLATIFHTMISGKEEQLSPFYPLFDEVYSQLLKQKQDELNEWLENYDSIMQESINEDRSEERRKYFKH